MSIHVPPPYLIMSAVISECSLYRYSLTRSIMPIVCLNPSRADAEVDDNSVRRIVGFAKREGYGGVRLRNLFALRSKDPEDLFGMHDPVGPDNHTFLINLVLDAKHNGDPIVCAWGAHVEAHGEEAYMPFLELAAKHGVKLKCFGRTKNNHPRHPLYLGAAQPLEDF